MKSKFKYEIHVSNTNNPNDNSEVVAKVTTLGDANIMVSALSNAVKSSPLVYEVKKISKLIYVTNKQVDNFIKVETDRLKINNTELLSEVNLVLSDLKEFPNDNKNQIKFYTRVLERLNNLNFNL